MCLKHARKKSVDEANKHRGYCTNKLYRYKRGVLTEIQQYHLSQLNDKM